MADVSVKAKKREKLGKGAAKKYRFEGMIPGEYYAAGEDNIHLLLDEKEAEATLTHVHGLINMQIEGTRKKFSCVIKDLHFDPVKGNLLHVDFWGVKAGENIIVSVPIVVKGTAAGVKSGGFLEHLIRELEIECLPQDIPEQLEVDVSNLEIGDVIHVKDLHYDKINILDDPEETILHVAHARIVKEEEEVEEEIGLEEEVQEPELVKSRKEEEEEEE